MSILFRELNKGFEDSMGNKREINTEQELISILNEIYSPNGEVIERVEFSSVGKDTRNNRDTFNVIASIKGNSLKQVVGRSNGFFEEKLIGGIEEKEFIPNSEVSEKVHIFWLKDADAHEVDANLWFDDEEEDSENKIQIPEYIRGQISSRTGRHGKGQLRVPSHIDFQTIENWKDDIFDGDSKYYGGILFEKKDSDYLKGFAGIITDIEMNVIGD